MGYTGWVYLYSSCMWNSHEFEKKKTSAAGWRRILQSHRLLGRQWSIYKDQLIKINVSSKLIYSKMRCASKQNPPVKFQNPQPWLNRNHSSQRSFLRRQDTKCEKIPRGVSAGIRTWSVPTGTSWPIWERFLGSAVKGMWGLSSASALGWPKTISLNHI